MSTYVVGLFSQVTCTSELISKFVQSKIAHSTRSEGVRRVTGRECNREIVRGDAIEGKTVESCLRWLMVMSHARRTEASIKKVDHMEERVFYGRIKLLLNKFEFEFFKG